MTQITLEASNLSVKFKDRLLFHIPMLKIGPGEAVYLTGQNGIGKTTLLKILAGIARPTSGSVNLSSPSWLQKLAGFAGQSGVVYMHQTPYLFDATVFENVAYGIRSYTLCQRTRRQNTIAALRMVGLEALAHEHISILSGGEKQKVAMARAWAMKPSVLLMDESSANLDPDAIADQKRMACDLLENGSSLVITSHQPNAMTACCSRYWTLQDQRLVDRPLLNIVDKDNHAFAS